MTTYHHGRQDYLHTVINVSNSNDLLRALTPFKCNTRMNLHIVGTIKFHFVSPRIGLLLIHPFAPPSLGFVKGAEGGDSEVL